MTLHITVQETPNPAARRLVVDRPLQEESRGRSFSDPDTADDALAAALLALDEVDRVLLLPTSVTITKTPAANWDDVEASAREVLEAHVS